MITRTRKIVLLVLCSMFVLLLVVGIKNGEFKEVKIETVEEAINDWSFEPEWMIEDIISIQNAGNDKVCLYITQTDNIAVTYIKNKGTKTEPNYEAFERVSYNIKDLNDACSDYTEFLQTDNGIVIYNVFINPQKDIVCINNQDVAIDEFEIKEGTKIGFWCFQTNDKKIVVE